MKLNKPEQPFKLYTSISLKKYVHFLLHKSLSTFIGNRLIHGLSFTLIDSAMRAQFVRQIGQEGQDGQNGQDAQDGQEDRTDFPGNFCRAVFAIFAMFFSGNCKALCES